MGNRPFSLTDEQLELRAAFRRFAERELAPNAERVDETAEYPAANFAAYRDSGFVRLGYPEAHGGEGADTLTFALFVEEVARVCGSSSLFVLISRLAMWPVLKAGSAELQARFVPAIAAGDKQGSYCLSEPDAGSDVAALSTRAQRDGDHYVIRGRKAWITNAGVSDVYVVFAKTDREAGHRGISVFVVERDMPGVSFEAPEKKMGMRGSPTRQMVLDDVVVPASNLVGEEGQGFALAMGALDSSRPIVAAQALGLAQGALDVATQYVVDRRQFDQRIADFQGVQFMLADMATQVEAARLLVYDVCARLDDGAPGISKFAAMAKLFASDTAMRVTTDAVQLLGGAGYTTQFPVERMMRDAKVTQIYEGTNQVQRIVIARRVLDEMRTP
jgi:alkylation response protein AidB-like acyl-CoA dehydrogenase